MELGKFMLMRYSGRAGGNECMRTSFISDSEANAPEADQQEQGRRVRQERDHTRAEQYLPQEDAVWSKVI